MTETQDHGPGPGRQAAACEASPPAGNTTGGLAHGRQPPPGRLEAVAQGGDRRQRRRRRAKRVRSHLPELLLALAGVSLLALAQCSPDSRLRWDPDPAPPADVPAAPVMSAAPAADDARVWTPPLMGAPLPEAHPAQRRPVPPPAPEPQRPTNTPDDAIKVIAERTPQV